MAESHMASSEPTELNKPTCMNIAFAWDMTGSSSKIIIIIIIIIII
jgi:hypothetical protein